MVYSVADAVLSLESHSRTEASVKTLVRKQMGFTWTISDKYMFTFHLQAVEQRMGNQHWLPPSTTRKSLLFLMALKGTMINFVKFYAEPGNLHLCESDRFDCSVSSSGIHLETRSLSTQSK